jgi:hypothetical protein
LSGIHETGLILATALREYHDWDDEVFFERTEADPESDQFYGASHVGHPLNEWVAEGTDNFAWTYDYIESLYHEKLHRYGGGHNTWENYARYLPRKPQCVPAGETPMYQACAPSAQCPDPVISYRVYYIVHKERPAAEDGHWMEWAQNRDPPEWLVRRDPLLGIDSQIAPQNVPQMNYADRDELGRPTRETRNPNWDND